MKNLLLLLLCAGMYTVGVAQAKKNVVARATPKNDLPSLQSCLDSAVQHVGLYTRNLPGPGNEHDVNSIVLDIERYIDSMPQKKTYSDELLLRNFAAMRHFFLTTTNKTTVATQFLYPEKPYTFCRYADTALTLYIGAIKDGDSYNLSKTTDKLIAHQALENCLLPSLAALDEVKDPDIKYVAVSIYYGCLDTRDGAPANPTVPYCITFIARLADVQQYAAGNLTEKGLMQGAVVY